MYTQHAKEATVAAYAPSGFYIASGGKRNAAYKLLNDDHPKKGLFVVK